MKRLQIIRIFSGYKSYDHEFQVSDIYAFIMKSRLLGIYVNINEIVRSTNLTYLTNTWSWKKLTVIFIWRRKLICDFFDRLPIKIVQEFIFDPTTKNIHTICFFSIRNIVKAQRVRKTSIICSANWKEEVWFRPVGGNSHASS